MTTVRPWIFRIAAALFGLVLVLLRKIHRERRFACCYLQIKAGLIIPILGIFAWAQVGHGSLVVVFGLKDGNISVASDSRGVIGYNTNDNFCKITTVGDKLIVTGTGEYGHFTNRRWDWTTLTIAHKVLSGFPQTQIARKDFTPLFVEKFAAALVNKFNAELRVRQSETTAFKPDKLLTTVIVIGPDEKGLVGEWTTAIKFKDGTIKGSKIAYNVPIEHKSELPVYMAAGRSEVAEEIFHRRTARGTQCQSEIQATAATFPAEEQSNFIARKLVEYSIRYLPPDVMGVQQVQTVGGPIDSVTIGPSGHIRWNEHKPECQ